MKQLSIKAILTAIFCNIIFGSAVPMIKLGYEQFDITDDVFSKILFAGIRFFLSGIIVYITDAILQHKIPRITRGNYSNVILVAVTYTFLQYIFNYIGISNTTGTISSVLASTSAFISVIFAHFCYKDDKLNFRKVIGSIIGFIGVLLACSVDKNISEVTFKGEGFILISATCFVIGSLFNKRASQLNNSFTVTSFNLIIGGAMLILVGAFGFKGRLEISLYGILILLYLIFVSSVGFTMWSRLLSKYPIGKLGVYNFIIPISGAMFSGIILGENILNLQYILSFICVSVGIIFVNIKKERSA